MKYSVEQLMKAKENLADLPNVAAKDKQAVSASEAVALMADVLRSLQGRGYTTDMLAKLLNEQGVDMSLATLRRYFRSTNSQWNKRPRKTNVANGKRRTAQAAPTVPVAPLPAPPPSPTPSHRQTQSSQQREEKRSTAFAVREDSNDI